MTRYCGRQDTAGYGRSRAERLRQGLPVDRMGHCPPDTRVVERRERCVQPDVVGVPAGRPLHNRAVVELEARELGEKLVDDVELPGAPAVAGGLERRLELDRDLVDVAT